jgi:hypothetical protein
MENISEVTALDNVIFILENKMENTQEFFVRRDLKTKLEQVKKDKEMLLNKQQEEDKKVSSEVEKKNKIDSEVSERNGAIKNRIKSYI